MAHWTNRPDVGPPRYRTQAQPGGRLGTILFVHGSSMGSQPTFDLQVPGRSDSSAMDDFARLGYDTWCVDMEGRSDKHRDINSDSYKGVLTMPDPSYTAIQLMDSKNLKNYFAEIFQ